MGSILGPDFGYSIALDSVANVFITGRSSAPWGNSATFHRGNYDAFINKLNNSGKRQTKIFLGSKENDSGQGITVDDNGNVIVVGISHISWGSPIQLHSGGVGQNDGFAAKLELTSPVAPTPGACTFFVIPLAGGKGVVVCL